MNITSESSSSTNKSTRSNVIEHIDDITNIADGQNKTLIIVLAVTLPTLAFITILTSLIICYRRRHTTIWLKKLDNSNKLKSIIVNLSSNSIQSSYSEKNQYISYPQFHQPRTKTIVYNRLSTPSSPIVYTPFKLSFQGETNQAFDENSFKNEEQSTTILQTDFPPSLQVPVPTITSTFVKAIAIHRLTLLTDTNNTLIQTSTSTSRQSDTSSSSLSHLNISQTILLFSQRTEL